MRAEPTALNFAAIHDELVTLLAANRLVLPGIPETAQQVCSAAIDPKPSLAEIARIAERDPVLAAYLIKVSNLVAFRRGETVRTVLNAVTRLGAQLTAVTATSFALLQLVARSPRHATRLRSLYRRSIEVGERAAALAQRCPHLVPEDALLAGLVHGIGVPVILQYVRDKPRLQTTAVLESLIERLHASAGAELLRLWRFPHHIVEAVALQEALHRGKAYDAADYADLLVAAKLGISRESEQAFAPGAPPALARLGLHHNGVQSQAANKQEAAEQIQELCRLMQET